MTKKLLSRLHWLRYPNAQVIMAVLLFMVSAVMTHSGGTTAAERLIFDVVYGLPEVVTPLFSWITHFGSFYVLLVLALMYLARQHYRAVIRLLMSGSLAYLLAGVAKDLVGRARPIELFEIDIIYRDYLVRGPGFPSGHAALAAAIGLTLMHILPRKYSWIAPVLIVGVALSRIHLGVHAPMDIVGGFAIGWASYAIFRNVSLRAVRRRPKTKNVSGLKKSRPRAKLKVEV